ncbi:MAG: hypothetical protein ACI9E5_000951 [Candidatus Omnitrophota bacterium]|jgi:hypothetical protein
MKFITCRWYLFDKSSNNVILYLDPEVSPIKTSFKSYEGGRIMMKRLLLCALSLCILASSAAVSFAEDVFVTKYGKKFHKEGSRFIKDRETIKMTREDAEEKGYKPSSDFLEEDKELETKEVETQEVETKEVETQEVEAKEEK